MPKSQRENDKKNVADDEGSDEKHDDKKEARIQLGTTRGFRTYVDSKIMSLRNWKNRSALVDEVIDFIIEVLNPSEPPSEPPSGSQSWTTNFDPNMELATIDVRTSQRKLDQLDELLMQYGITNRTGMIQTVMVLLLEGKGDYWK